MNDRVARATEYRACPPEGPDRPRRRPRPGLRLMMTAGLVAGVLAGPALGIQSASAKATSTKRTAAVGIDPFVHDVFVNQAGILVNPDATTPDATELFNVSGTALPVTWGMFRSATATSKVKTVTTRKGDFTDFRIVLTGLVPDGVYSLFYTTFAPDSSNPVCPDVDRTVALTARHPKAQRPDSSSFVAGAGGTATFHARVPGRLMDSDLLRITVIYHADGQAYGPTPNRGESLVCRSSFGEDALRQFDIVQKDLVHG